MSDLSKRIPALMKARKWKAADLVRESGVKQAALWYILKNPNVNPRADTLAKIAAAFGLSIDRLRDEEDPSSTPDIGDAQLAPPRLLSSVRTLPILGRAEGGDGVMILDADAPPIGYVVCPQSLESVTSAFAVYIVGDSMVPTASPGDIAYVHPHRAPERDRPVLVVKNDNRALVKTFVKRTDKALHLAQLNPSGPVIVPAADIKNVYRIVGIWEG